MSSFSIAAYKGGAVNVGRCGCGAPIPALLIDHYEAEYQCPHCGKISSIKVSMDEELVVRLKSK